MTAISAEMKQKLLIDLEQAEFNVEDELRSLNDAVDHDLPVLRIEHHPEGKHRFFVDSGDSYLENHKQYTHLKTTSFYAIVIAEQYIRALWLEGEERAQCSSIDDLITSQHPVAKSCKHCPESIPGIGSCKPKVRLFIIPLRRPYGQTMIFSLPPTSIKSWSDHKQRLHRSGLPVVAMKCTFELEDVKNDDFRWAKIRVGVRDLASKSNLIVAKRALQEISRRANHISTKDYDEIGDKILVKS